MYLGKIGLFIEVLNVEYKLSVSIAYVMAVTFHFIINRVIKFASEKIPIIIQFLILISLINADIMLGIMFFMMDVLQMSYYIATIFALTLTNILGYLASKFLMFN